MNTMGCYESLENVPITPPHKGASRCRKTTTTKQQGIVGRKEKTED